MSRIFLIGAGPMMDGGARRVTAHAVRTWHFASVLRRAGHEVHLSTVSQNLSTSDPVGEMIEPRCKDGFEYENLDMRVGNMHAHLQDRCTALEPDCVIGVSAEPASWACRIGATVPVWADLHGWVMAEAQLKAARDGDDAILEYFWQRERPVLRRSDRISAVSDPQRFAVLGELGSLGRLNRHNVECDLVVSIPSSVDPAAKAPEKPAENPVSDLTGQDAFVILWSGGFNTWTDGLTLFDSLERAMEHDSRIHFVATGGPIPGHADVVYDTFRQSVERSPHRSQYHLLEWVEAERFPGFLAGSHLALCVDLPCVETWTGTRTRLLETMGAGLAPVLTRGTELSHELERSGIGWVVPPCDPAALGEELVKCASEPDSTETMGKRARAFVIDRYSFERTMAPVVRWAEKPQFAPDNAVRREKSAAIADVGLNPLDSAACALDDAPDLAALIRAGREYERLRARPPWKWFFRR